MNYTVYQSLCTREEMHIPILGVVTLGQRYNYTLLLIPGSTPEKGHNKLISTYTGL